MDIAGILTRLAWGRALEWLDRESSQDKKTVQNANDICDGFERAARRVPKNICSDPEIEAKRIVSACLKSGLPGFEKSLIGCLNEADDSYMEEFADKLKLAFSDYLELDLIYDYKACARERTLELSMQKRQKPFAIRIAVSKAGSSAAESKANVVFPGNSSFQERFCDPEDFQALLA